MHLSLKFDFGSKTGPLGPNVAAKISPGGSVLVAKTDPPFKGIVRCAATNFLPFVSLYACLHWHVTSPHACICITPNCSHVIYRSMQLELPASTMHAVARRLLILKLLQKSSCTRSSPVVGGSKGSTVLKLPYCLKLVVRER